MADTNYNLSDLRDIALPEAPGIWPFAPGLWALIGLCVMVGIALSFWAWQRRKQNGYRRAGLQLLANTATTYEVSVLLKRVALAVYPREHVAPLHGEAWARFLGFEPNAFSKPEAPASAELRKLAAKWIREHKVERSPAC